MRSSLRSWIILAATTAATLQCAASLAQTAAPPLDAAASDPNKMGWMIGSPPPPDKLIRFSDAGWSSFPKSRWSFSHIREILPTRVVPRGAGSPSKLPRAERSNIDGLQFQPLGRDDTMTWEQSLSANYTDGIVILHRGRIVYERYFGALNADRPHIAFSVTKSFTATLAGILIAEGTLNEGANVASYLPELQSSGIGNATLRQLLDMTTGVDFSENYADPKSSIAAYSVAGGFSARPANYQGPDSFFDYFKTLKQAYPHDEKFSYKTVNTDTLAAVMRRVTGKSTSELLQERIFGKLGAEQDAYMTVDSTGADFAGGGLNLTLRDLARFGEAMRQQGKYNGQQIVPKSFVDDVQRGGDRALFAAAGYKTLAGGSYRSMWWILHNEHGAYMARGIHGQAIYIDPKAEMVIARFASHPQASNVSFDATTLPAFAAVADLLMKSRR